MANTDKQNQYFLKDKRALIYKACGYITDSLGQSITIYKPVSASPYWCYSKQLSEDLYFAAKLYEVNETRYFVFNNHKEIEPLTCSILYRGNWYEVTRVDTKDDYNGEMFVYVKDRKTIPEKQLKPYDYEPEED